MRTIINRLMITSAVFCLIATGVTGCTPPQSPPPLTIAVTGTSHEPAVDLASVTPRVTEHARNALYPRDGEVAVLVQGRPAVRVDLTPMRGAQVEASPHTATDKINKKLPALAEALHQGAATGGLDALGVLDQAIQHTPRGGTILLYTSGISTVAPLDLTRAGAWIVNPAALVDGINPADLPDATERHIVFAGIGYGDPAGHQPTAGPASRTALQIIWRDICAATHAATCTILDGPAGTNSSGGANQVPVVTFDSAVTPCVGSITLSADIAFEPHSAILNDAADEVLAPIARSLAACPAGYVVNAEGHTATVPGDGNGIVLSANRAQAVLDRLVHLGTPPAMIGTATGYGNTRQPVNNMPNGSYSETLARRNRIVHLSTTTG